MILLDTHTLLWWTNDDKEHLPSSLYLFIQQALNKKTLYVSAISFWEIAHLYKKDKIKLKYDLDTWVKIVLSIPFAKVIVPDVSLLVKSVQMEGFHKDPADRIIVATAQSLGATIITKDDRILNYKQVRSRWE